MVTFCLNLVLLFTISFFLFRKFAKEKDKLLFSVAFGIRILAGISFAAIYIFIYNREGDSFFQFEIAGKLAETFKTDFPEFIRNIFGVNFPYWRDGNSAYLKILSLLHIITNGNYLLCTLYFSLFSFFCSWKLYSALKNFNAQLRFPAIISFLFTPSVLLWSSGCMTYSLTLSVLFLNVFFLLKIIKFSDGLGLGISFFILTSAFLFFLDKIIFLTAFSLSAGLIVSAVFQKYSPPFKKYFWLRWIAFLLVCNPAFLIINSFDSPMKDLGFNFSFQTNSELEKEKLKNNYSGNSFDIGQYEPVLTPSRIFRAVTVAFFPTPPVKTFFSVAAWIENTFLILLFPVVIFWLIRRFFITKKSKGSVEITALCFFILGMAFAAGLSSSNFGFLIRKRILFEPFLFFVLLIPFFKIMEALKLKMRKSF